MLAWRAAALSEYCWPAGQLHSWVLLACRETALWVLLTCRATALWVLLTCRATALMSFAGLQGICAWYYWLEGLLHSGIAGIILFVCSSLVQLLPICCHNYPLLRKFLTGLLIVFLVLCIIFNHTILIFLSSLLLITVLSGAGLFSRNTIFCWSKIWFFVSNFFLARKKIWG